MKINREVVEALYNEAGEKLTKQADRYVELKRVEMEKSESVDINHFDLYSKVAGRKIFDVHISVRDGKIEKTTCGCDEYAKKGQICKHIVATMKCYEREENSTMKQQHDSKIKNNDVKYKGFKQILKSFYQEDLDDVGTVKKKEEFKGKVHIVPKVILDKISGELKVEFQLGREKFYRIKNLAEFYERMISGKTYQYGDKLELVHEEEQFYKEDIPLLDFILKYSEIIRYVNLHSNPAFKFNGKVLNEGYIVLSDTGLDELFEILEEKEIDFEIEYKQKVITFVPQNPKIEIKVEKINEGEYKLVPSVDVYKLNILKGKEYTYILGNNHFYQCDEQYTNTMIKLLELFRKNYSTEVKLGVRQLPELFSIIMPQIQDNLNISQIDKEDIETYMPKDLIIKVYLDFDKNEYMIAEVRFRYGDQEFNPLNEKEVIQIPRNTVKETKAFQIFKQTGFQFDAKKYRFVLPKEDDIYKFLTEDIELYMQKFEVLATDRFKKKQITKPKITNLGIKVENDLLSIDLTNLNIDSDELKNIMEKYHLKKKYHRLKNGDFLSLEENKDLAFIDKLINGMDLEYDDLSQGLVTIPASRSLYLNQILKNMNHTEVTKNQQYKEMVNGLNKEQLEETTKLPEKLANILRYYQKTGFKWLKVLDDYNFGGILADDMGLR